MGCLPVSVDSKLVPKTLGIKSFSVAINGPTGEMLKTGQALDDLDQWRVDVQKRIPSVWNEDRYEDVREPLVNGLREIRDLENGIPQEGWFHFHCRANEKNIRDGTLTVTVEDAFGRKSYGLWNKPQTLRIEQDLAS